MKVIGVVGGIGSGKSTVVGLLSEMTKGYVIKADQIGHKILQKGNLGYIPVVETFGPKILGPEGEIDRKILGGIVFSDPLELQRLNNISHPLIYKIVKEKIKLAKEKAVYDYIIVDAALLIEIRLIELVEEVWGVHLPLEEQIKRIMLRNSFSREEATKRIATQLPWEEIKKIVDVEINNGATISYTKEQIRRLLK